MLRGEGGAFSWCSQERFEPGLKTVQWLICHSLLGLSVPVWHGPGEEWYLTVLCPAGWVVVASCRWCSFWSSICCLMVLAGSFVVGVYKSVRLIAFVPIPHATPAPWTVAFRWELVHYKPYYFYRNIHVKPTPKQHTHQCIANKFLLQKIHDYTL